MSFPHNRVASTRNSWLTRVLSRPFNLGVTMSGEQKLWMVVLLQGIAETDPEYVKGAGEPYAKEKIHKDALVFVASTEFDDLCRSVNVTPKFMRAIKPAKAYLAANLLLAQVRKPDAINATPEELCK